MKRRWLIAIAALPLPVVIVIPAGLVWLFRTGRWAHVIPTASNPFCWLGAVAGAVGLALAIWSALTFARFADGTPAPWDPPEQFVVRGPYRYVRNPMILGVFHILLGQALMLQSYPLFTWFVIFVSANAFYIPFVEEERLARRFRGSYVRYKTHVPRWIPRTTPWHSINGSGQNRERSRQK